MFRLQPKLALLVMAAIPLFYLALKVVGRRLRPLAARLQDEHAAAIAIAEENLGMLPAIKTFTREQEESGRFRSQIDQILHLTRRQLRIHASLDPVVQFIAAHQPAVRARLIGVDAHAEHVDRHRRQLRQRGLIDLQIGLEVQAVDARLVREGHQLAPIGTVLAPPHFGFPRLQVCRPYWTLFRFWPVLIIPLGICHVAAVASPYSLGMQPRLFGYLRPRQPFLAQTDNVGWRRLSISQLATRLPRALHHLATLAIPRGAPSWSYGWGHIQAASHAYAGRQAPA